MFIDPKKISWGDKMKSWIPAIVGLGMLLLFIGVVYGKFAETETIMKIAGIIKDTGIFLSGIGFFIGAVTDTEEDKNIRLGMLVASAIIISMLVFSAIRYWI